MKAVLFALLMLVPGVAWADCWLPGENTDEKPLPVEFCDGGQCETTAIDGYCKAPGARGISFQNGWAISWDVDHGMIASKNEIRHANARLTCKALFDDLNEDVISPTCWFKGLGD